MIARTKSAFTLIELLLVIAIIAALMAMLLPAVSAVQRTVFIAESRNRMSVISEAINQYAQTYDGIYPPSNRTGTWDYPLVAVPASGIQVPFFNPNHVGPTHGTNHGHSYLTYFLMGPNNAGWDPGLHGVKKAWIPPDALRTYLTSVIVGRHNEKSGATLSDSSFAYYGFADAWGPQGARYNLTGSFQYCLPYPRGGYQKYDMYDAYYWGGTRGFEKGDGADAHMARVYKNIGSQKFILVSAGADRKFGFYRWDKTEDRYLADAVNGVSDDIANVPMN